MQLFRSKSRLALRVPSFFSAIGLIEEVSSGHMRLLHHREPVTDSGLLPRFARDQVAATLAGLQRKAFVVGSGAAAPDVKMSGKAPTR